MEMNWILGIVCVAGIVALVVIVDMYLKAPKAPKDSDFRAENEKLKGQIEALEMKYETEKLRGDRHMNGRDAAEKRYHELQEVFTKMIQNASEIENLKALLNKCPPAEKKNA